MQSLLAILDDDEDVSYYSWSKTDSTDLRFVTESKIDFEENFRAFVPRLILHDYINSMQKLFISQTKSETLLDESVVMISADFGQNYTFVIQDAIQSYHWINKQATIHPFVAHFWSREEAKVVYKTYFVISDDMKHDAATFHAFRGAIMKQLKLNHPRMQKIIYISDGTGAVSSYKIFYGQFIKCPFFCSCSV